MRVHRFCLLLLLGLAGRAGAEVIDVSAEWKAHASTSPVAIGANTVTTRVPPEPVESSSTLAASCGCESSTIHEKLSDATIAFTGQVYDVQAPKKGRRSTFFDVDEIFKGTPKPETEIVSEVTGSACDLTFDEGKTYLVYARWEWGKMVSTRCMGTTLIQKTDSSALGPSESMKEKLYIHLRDACMGRSDTACCLSSLKAMRANYDLPEPEGGCLEGTIPDRLRCAGSYVWCIPVTENDRRHSQSD